MADRTASGVEKVAGVSLSELSISSTTRRAIAWMVDLLVLAVILIILFALVGGRGVSSALPGDGLEFSWGDSGWYLSQGCLAVYVCLCYGYFTLCEWRLGATIGKLVVAIRVVTDTGGRPRIGQAAIRNLLRIVDASPYVIPYLTGVILMKRNQRDRRLGDSLAGTNVIDCVSESVLPSNGGRRSTLAVSMRRYSGIASLLGVLFVGAFFGDAIYQSSSSPFDPRVQNDSQGWGWNKGRVGQILDTAVMVGNTSRKTITVRAPSYAFGLSRSLHEVGAYVAPVDAKIVAYLPASYGWPPRASSLKLSFRPLEAYLLGPTQEAGIYVGVRPTAPGVYFVQDPTVRGDRDDFWSLVPGVGGQWTHTYGNSYQSFCVDLSTDLCAISGDLKQDLPAGSQVLAIHWYLKHVGSGSQGSRSGYFLEEMPYGRTAKVWFTVKDDQGDFTSRVMKVGKGWQASISGGRCSRPLPPEDAIVMRVWTKRPDGTHREPLPEGSPQDLWYGGEYRSSTGWTGSGTPSGGSLRLQVQTRCHWNVYIYSTTGPISL